MSNNISTSSSKEKEIFLRLTEAIQRHCKQKLSDQEKYEAARNIIAFCKIALEIERRMSENFKHDKHD